MMNQKHMPLFPKPHFQPGRPSHDKRHATWTELFYDLAYVVAISVIAHRLSLTINRQGLLHFIMFYTPVWLLWMDNTFYSDRFDTDDIWHRLCFFIQMTGITGLAVFAHAGFPQGFYGFIASYLVVRVIIIFNYLRAASSKSDAKKLARIISTTHLTALVPWIAAFFFGAPASYYLAGTALLIDILGPPVLSSGAWARVRVDISHLPERFGLFTIIVLGESIASVAGGLGQNPFTFRALITGFFGMLLAFSLWWTYFENIENVMISQIRHLYLNKSRDLRSYFQSVNLVYGNFVLTMGLTLIGVGLYSLISTGPGTVPSQVMWLICTAAAASFFIIGNMELGDAEAEISTHHTVALVLRYGAAALILGAAVSGLFTTSFAILGFLAFVGSVQIFWGVFTRKVHSLGDSNISS